MHAPQQKLKSTGKLGPYGIIRRTSSGAALCLFTGASGRHVKLPYQRLSLENLAQFVMEHV